MEYCWSAFRLRYSGDLSHHVVSGLCAPVFVLFCRYQTDLLFQNKISKLWLTIITIPHYDCFLVSDFG